MNPNDINNVTNETTAPEVVQETVHQEEQSGYVNMINVQAEVLGELRKDKIGKPILVLEIAILFAIVLIALPIVNGMLDNPNSALNKLLNSNNGGGVVHTKPVDKENEFADGSQLQPLDGSVVMMNDNIVLKDFKLSNGKVECVMYSYNGKLDLDNDSYYLEVYTNTKQLHAYYKLNGAPDNVEQKITLERADKNYNSDLKYFGKIVKVENYPSVTIQADEFGVGYLTCTKNSNTYKYKIKNGYLIGIENNEKVLVGDMQPQEYLNALKNYKDKAAVLTPFATVEEVDDGFVFNANVDLETPGYVLPDGIKDYNYYKLDTKVELIHYAMVGKGFDCK